MNEYSRSYLKKISHFDSKQINPDRYISDEDLSWYEPLILNWDDDVQKATTTSTLSARNKTISNKTFKLIGIGILTTIALELAVITSFYKLSEISKPSSAPVTRNVEIVDLTKHPELVGIPNLTKINRP